MKTVLICNRRKKKKKDLQVTIYTKICQILLQLLYKCTGICVKYMLGIIVAAYREFMDRTKLVEEKTISKPDWIEETIKNHLGQITKSEILKLVPGVSQTTVQRTLTDLVKNGKIIKDGDGRYTKYHWNWEAEEQ